MRSVLVSVRNLARSVTFYCDVLGLREAVREGEVAVLEGERATFAMLLREVTGQGVRHGQQEYGLRAICFDVGSRAELDSVADRLEAAEALVSRSPLQEAEHFDVVTGRDPDGLPLTFITYETDQPLDADHFRHVALHMYGVDL
jgi:catechol 2,3-dioxygenase-like lactoylglutathione lyase family enzyme